jgi:uncharacterized protein
MCWKLFVGLSCLAAAAPIGAASFDCSKARSVSEKFICGNPALSRMDDELAVVYARAKAAAPDKEAFAAETRRRWQEREDGCIDAACLRLWYAARRRELEGGASPAPPAPATLAAMHAEMVASRAERERLQNLASSPPAPAPPRTPMQILAAPRDDEVLRISGPELEVAYEGNELAVERRMEGKGAVDVTGQVFRVARDGDGYATIVMRALGTYQAFHLMSNQEAVNTGLPVPDARAAGLRVGQAVTVRCAMVTRPLPGYVTGAFCFLP